MFSPTVKIKLVFALLLAMSMAWGGHVAARLAHPLQPLVESADGHEHAHAGAEQACALCQLQHEHSPLTADHLHETPYPIVPLELATLGERSPLLAAAPYALSEAPVFLIERPPRPSSML